MSFGVGALMRTDDAAASPPRRGPLFPARPTTAWRMPGRSPITTTRVVGRADGRRLRDYRRHAQAAAGREGAERRGRGGIPNDAYQQLRLARRGHVPTFTSAATSPPAATRTLFNRRPGRRRRADGDGVGHGVAGQPVQPAPTATSSCTGCGSERVTFNDNDGSGKDALIHRFRVPANDTYSVGAMRTSGTTATLGRIPRRLP